MKKLIIITNIKYNLEDTNVVVPAAHDDNDRLLQVDFRSLVANIGEFTCNMQVADIDADNNQALILQAAQKWESRDMDYSDWLYRLEPDANSIVLSILNIDLPQTLLIVMTEHEYTEDYYDLFDADEATIKYNLLLDYLPMNFKYGYPQ